MSLTVRLKSFWRPARDIALCAVSDVPSVTVDRYIPVPTKCVIRSSEVGRFELFERFELLERL